MVTPIDRNSTDLLKWSINIFRRLVLVSVVHSNVFSNPEQISEAPAPPTRETANCVCFHKFLWRRTWRRHQKSASWLYTVLKSEEHALRKALAHLKIYDLFIFIIFFLVSSVDSKSAWKHHFCSCSKTSTICAECLTIYITTAQLMTNNRTIGPGEASVITSLSCFLSVFTQNRQALTTMICFWLRVRSGRFGCCFSPELFMFFAFV